MLDPLVLWYVVKNYSQVHFLLGKTELSHQNDCDLQILQHYLSSNRWIFCIKQLNFNLIQYVSKCHQVVISNGNHFCVVITIHESGKLKVAASGEASISLMQHYTFKVGKEFLYNVENLIKVKICPVAVSRMHSTLDSRSLFTCIPEK